MQKSVLPAHALTDAGEIGVGCRLPDLPGTIDDLLGPAAQRFFGHGYRRVQHGMRAVDIVPDQSGGGQIRAVGAVCYPADWSTKSDCRELRPHLSSIDAVVLSVQLAEAYLTHSLALSGAQRRAMWVSRIEMQAGSAPQENLHGFPVRATHVATAEVPPGGAVSRFECQVGTIKVRCEIAHEAGAAHSAAGAYADLADILGPAESRYYGAGYKSRSQLVRDVVVDEVDQRAEATFHIDDPAGQAGEGLGADYQPAASAIDSVVGSAQLAQALLYQLDGVDRGSSNTLWMRRIVIECCRPERPFRYRLRGSVAITRTRLLSIGGTMWRNGEMAVEFGDIVGRCVLAHQLPEGR